MISIQQFHITNIYFIFTSSQQSSSHHLLFFQLSFLFFSFFSSHHLVLLVVWLLVIWFSSSGSPSPPSSFLFLGQLICSSIYSLYLPLSLISLSLSYSPSNITHLCTMPKHLMISLGALDAALSMSST